MAKDRSRMRITWRIIPLCKGVVSRNDLYQLLVVVSKELDEGVYMYQN